MAASDSSRRPLVLEFTKRRYDGGPEIEIIKHIEFQYQMAEYQKLLTNYQSVPLAPASFQQTVPGSSKTDNESSSRENPSSPVDETPKKGKRDKSISYKIQQIIKAFVLPYIELLFGLSGLLTGAVICTSLGKLANSNPNALKAERMALIRQSWLVIGKSLFDIIAAPWVILKACFQ